MKLGILSHQCRLLKLVVVNFFTLLYFYAQYCKLKNATTHVFHTVLEPMQKIDRDLSPYTALHAFFPIDREG